MSEANGQARLVAKRHGHEVWAAWDPTARVWETYASGECDDYLGCHDDYREVQAFAKAHLDEIAAELGRAS